MKNLKIAALLQPLAKIFSCSPPGALQKTGFLARTMATALPRRIAALVALVALGTLAFVVQAPQHHRLVGHDALAAGSETPLGLCPAKGSYPIAEVAGEAGSDSAVSATALPRSLLDESVLVAALDLQEAHPGQPADETPPSGQAMAFAPATDNLSIPDPVAYHTGALAQHGTQGQNHSPSPGKDGAGQKAGSASLAGSLGRPALLPGAGGMAGMAQPEKNFYPATDGNEADRLVSIVGTAEGGGLAPSLSGTGGMASSSPQDDNSSRPGPGHPGTAAVPGAPQAGQGNGPPPILDTGGVPGPGNFSTPPGWSTTPSAGDGVTGSLPATGCPGTGPCNALVATANNRVPEPGSLALLGLGLVGLVLSHRRCRRKAGAATAAAAPQ